MNEIHQMFGTVPAQMMVLLTALITALIAFAIQRRNTKSTVFGKFIDVLARDIAALNAAGSDTDAYAILQSRFVAQHDAFIHAFHIAGLLRKRNLKRTWENYYGEEGEQDWWLPNEYSALMSNQLKNTNKNTKELAIHRLKSIINVCK